MFRYIKFPIYFHSVSIYVSIFLSIYHSDRGIIVGIHNRCVSLFTRKRTSHGSRRVAGRLKDRPCVRVENLPITRNCKPYDRSAPTSAILSFRWGQPAGNFRLPL